MKNYETKICLRCGKEYKPTSGKQKYCVECKVVAKKEHQKQYVKQYYKDYAEKRKEQQKQWYKDNLEYTKQYYESHKEQIKKYHEDHTEKKKEYDKQYYQSPGGKEARKRYYQTSKGKEVGRRHQAKHRKLGYIPYNKYFEGSHFHHLIQKGDGLYIPEELHKNIYHNIWTGQGMEKINTVAVQWWVTEVRKATH